MRRLFAGIAAGVALFAAPADAAALLDCGGSDTAYRTVCNEQELRALGGEIDQEMARLLRGADPLTAMLLKRDQVYFTDILYAANVSEFRGQDDQNYKRILEVLKQRRRALARMRTGPVTAPEGNWANALASVTVAKDGDAFSINLKARVSYVDANIGEVACALTATAKPGKDGWYTAVLHDKDTDGQVDAIRFRLQGSTLRIVRDTSTASDACTGRETDEAESEAKPRVDILTGSYFPVGQATTGAGSAARAVSPSFDCGKAENADEEEICADPELAAADVEIAKLYRDALRRLEPKLAAHLRTDQRAWASDNSTDFVNNLQPGSDKMQGSVHHTDSARRQLFLRQKERLLLLGNLDDKRKGIEGVWLSHNSSFTLLPAKDKGDGMLHAEGAKWDVSDYKSHCDYSGAGKIEKGKFTGDDIPTLTRDGGTLVVAAEDPDKYDDFFDKDGNAKREQPDYCSRMRSPKARLFPIKAGTGIEAIWRQLYFR